MKLLKNNTESLYSIDIGDLRLPIKIKKLRSSRRLVVRYQPATQSVLLTLPYHARIKQGLDFINDKREWIQNQISQYSSTKPFCDGQTIPVLGRDITLKHIGGRGTVSQYGDELQVHGDPEFMPRRVQQWLTLKAHTEIITIAEEFAKKTGVKINNITLRDTSSRWGSCSYDGNLSFSWRLVFAPREVLAYVVAHEVAHISEHNHSKYFWQLVAEIYPDYEACEEWLKKHGKTLYLYGNYSVKTVNEH